MIAVACPICQTPVEFEPVLDTIVVCPECGEAWRLAELEPPRLVYALDMEEEPALETDEDHPRGTPA